MLPVPIYCHLSTGHQYPSCCASSARRAKTTQVVRNLRSTRCQSESLKSLKKTTLCCYLTGIAGSYEEKYSKIKSNLIFQPFTLGSQTQQLIDDCTRPEQTKPIPQGEEIQNGDTGNHQNLPPSKGEWVTSIDFKMPTSISQRQEQSRKYMRFYILGRSFGQGTAIRTVHSSHGVYYHSKGGETDGHTQGYKDSLVPR